MGLFFLWERAGGNTDLPKEESIDHFGEMREVDAGVYEWH
jgi:hypothetical protein